MIWSLDKSLVPSSGFQVEDFGDVQSNASVSRRREWPVGLGIGQLRAGLRHANGQWSGTPHRGCRHGVGTQPSH